jgi:hypothetical protein
VGVREAVGGKNEVAGRCADRDLLAGLCRACSDEAQAAAKPAACGSDAVSSTSCPTRRLFSANTKAIATWSKSPMKSNHPSPESPLDPLEFRATVVRYFEFVDALHYQLSLTNSSRIVYRSDLAEFVIEHDQFTYEITSGLHVLEEWFSTGDMLDTLNIDALRDWKDPQASTRERVELLVPQLAEIVRTYCTPILRDPLAWREPMRAMRERRRLSAARIEHLERLRTQADTAYHARSFTDMLAAYAQIPAERLTPIDLARIASARNHLT